MNNYYTWITSKIAIGDCDSNYNDFDIVVNINFPYNSVRKNTIYQNKYSDKIVYLVGLHDDASEPMYDCLRHLIPKLYEDHYDKKILFHCYAGISRSSTLALALLKYHSNSTLLNCYCYAKAKRPQILPNEGFIKALTDFTNDDSLEKFIIKENIFKKNTVINKDNDAVNNVVNDVDNDKNNNVINRN